MSEPARQSRMTVREFLRWEDGTDTRYELVRGQPVAMAPPSGPHAELCRSIFLHLDARLRAPCRAYSAPAWRDPGTTTSVACRTCS